MYSVRNIIRLAAEKKLNEATENFNALLEAKIEERIEGMVPAVGATTFAEDVEALDEISKKLAANYVVKAGPSADKHAKKFEKSFTKEMETGRMTGKTDYHKRKLDNREKGIDRAGKVLNKEEAEAIDEISRQLASSYKKKALNVQGKLWTKALNKGGHVSDNDYRKINNTEKGVARAEKRINKEETVVEASAGELHKLDSEINAKKSQGKLKPYDKLSMRREIIKSKLRGRK